MLFPRTRRTWGRGGRKVKCRAHFGGSEVGLSRPAGYQGCQGRGPHILELGSQGQRSPFSPVAFVCLWLCFYPPPTLGRLSPFSFGPSRVGLKAEGRSAPPAPAGCSLQPVVSEVETTRAILAARQSADAGPWSPPVLRSVRVASRAASEAKGPCSGRAPGTHQRAISYHSAVQRKLAEL